MSFLSKFFDYVSAEERRGIFLPVGPCWEISGIKDFPLFLKGLSDLVSLGSVLYLEGGDTPKKLKKYLEERCATNTCKVEMGTVWPHPQCFHMQITYDNLEGLAKLCESYALPEVAIHIHVYNDGKMLSMWYDAFYDPLYISNEISEDKIKDFCCKLGAKYKQEIA